jgi:DHA1 family bicyclomycin/chloramphenicol resistance-like MFS transporter
MSQSSVTNTATTDDSVPPKTPHLLLLAAIVALGPLSVDLYLPALPSMVIDLNTSLSQVQMTLSSYLAGFALFHLACGPLSDRYGRRPVLLGGLALYVLASIACALAQNIETLLIWRFIQAMGACCAPTLGRAMVRDSYPPEQSAKMLAYLGSLMALAPVIAPSLGGQLLHWFDWRAMFWVLSAAAAILIVLVARMPETLAKSMPLSPSSIIANFKTLILSQSFMLPVMTAAILYSGAFAFLSGASFILIGMFGVSSEHFGIYFIFMVMGYIGGNLYTARWGYKLAEKTTLLAGILIATAAAAVMLFAMMNGHHHPLWIVIPMLFYTAGIGVMLPQTMAMALKPFPHMAATASAMMGFLQMSVAALAGWLVGATLTDHPTPMAAVIFGTGSCSLLLFVCFHWASKRQQKQP